LDPATYPPGWSACSAHAGQAPYLTSTCAQSHVRDKHTSMSASQQHQSSTATQWHQDCTVTVTFWCCNCNSWLAAISQAKPATHTGASRLMGMSVDLILHRASLYAGCSKTSRAASYNSTGVTLYTEPVTSGTAAQLLHALT
jgi:hypothetical protein